MAEDGTAPELPPAAEPAAAEPAAAEPAAAEPAADPTHEIGGKSYKYLADGEYDVIICGTGTTECILSGLFATNKKRVLHIDRNDYYGAAAASLNLTNLFRKFKSRAPTEEEFKSLGSNRDYNVDLVPKFLMASGELVKLLIHTKVTRYLDFKVVDGSYVYKGHSRKVKLAKVPSSMAEALSTPLMGFFQKNKLRRFLAWLDKVESDSKSVGGVDVAKKTAAEVFAHFGLDSNTISFLGHAMALNNSEEYLSRNCMETLNACKLYGLSMARHANAGSPYLYPLYGLGGLAEGFARLCAVYGGTFMLHQPIDELLYDDDGKAIGVRAGDMVAKAPHIIGDPSYFPAEKTQKACTVVRSIFLLDHPIEQTKNAESCQVVIPAPQVSISGYPARTKDIYISCVSFAHMVAPKGMWIAIVSTEAETSTPLEEIKPGVDLLGKYIERFDDVAEGVCAKVREADGCYISSTYDGTSHFQSCAKDVQRIFKAVTGEDIDMSIEANTDAE